MIELYIDFVLFVALISLLYWLFYAHHRRLVLDETRNELFEVRERLWREANSGRFDKGSPPVNDCEDGERPAGFDDESYNLIRRTINGAIRYLDDLTFWSVVILLVSESSLRQGKKFQERFLASLEGHSEEAQKLLWHALIRTNIAILATVVRRSMILLAILFVLKLISRILRKWKLLRESLAKSEFMWAFDYTVNRPDPSGVVKYSATYHEAR